MKRYVEPSWRALSWVWEHLFELAAVVVILMGLAGFLSETNPLIWQGALGFLLLLGAYEFGYRRGESSVKAAQQDEHPPPEQVRNLIETDVGLIAQAIEGIDGWFVIREGGDIVLQPEEELDPDRQGMLYVFASRAAYDAGERDSSKVSRQGLEEVTRLSGGATSVFLRKMGDFLERHYDTDERLYEIDDDKVEVELNLSEVMEAVEYIQGERDPLN